MYGMGRIIDDWGTSSTKGGQRELQHTGRLSGAADGTALVVEKHAQDRADDQAVSLAELRQAPQIEHQLRVIHAGGHLVECHIAGQSQTRLNKTLCPSA